MAILSRENEHMSFPPRLIKVSSTMISDSRFDVPFHFCRIFSISNVFAASVQGHLNAYTHKYNKHTHIYEYVQANSLLNLRFFSPVYIVYGVYVWAKGTNACEYTKHIFCLSVRFLFSAAKSTRNNNCVHTDPMHTTVREYIFNNHSDRRKGA